MSAHKSDNELQTLLGKNSLAASLWNVAHFEGVSRNLNANGQEEFFIRGRMVDAYLLVAVLAERIASGDIQLVEIGDSCGRKDYYDKLKMSVSRMMDGSKAGPSKGNHCCRQCGGPIEYNTKYDACFCPKCDIWLEEKCGDPNCEFCASRPDRPSQAQEN